MMRKVVLISQESPRQGLAGEGRDNQACQCRVQAQGLFYRYD